MREHTRNDSGARADGNMPFPNSFAYPLRTYGGDSPTITISNTALNCSSSNLRSSPPPQPTVQRVSHPFFHDGIIRYLRENRRARGNNVPRAFIRDEQQAADFPHVLFPSRNPNRVLWSLPGERQRDIEYEELLCSCGRIHGRYICPTRYPPENGSMAPHLMCLAPENGSMAPHMMYLAPENRSMAPDMMYLVPENGSMAPHLMYLAPEDGSMAPHIMYLAPENERMAPHMMYLVPENESMTPHMMYLAPEDRGVAHMMDLAPENRVMAPMTDLAPENGGISHMMDLAPGTHDNDSDADSATDQNIPMRNRSPFSVMDLESESSTISIRSSNSSGNGSTCNLNNVSSPQPDAEGNSRRILQYRGECSLIDFQESTLPNNKRRRLYRWEGTLSPCDQPTADFPPVNSPPVYPNEAIANSSVAQQNIPLEFEEIACSCGHSHGRYLCPIKYSPEVRRSHYSRYVAQRPTDTSNSSTENQNSRISGNFSERQLYADLIRGGTFVFQWLPESASSTQGQPLQKSTADNDIAECTSPNPSPRVIIVPSGQERCSVASANSSNIVSESFSIEATNKSSVASPSNCCVDSLETSGLASLHIQTEASVDSCIKNYSESGMEIPSVTSGGLFSHKSSENSELCRSLADTVPSCSKDLHDDTTISPCDEATVVPQGNSDETPVDPAASFSKNDLSGKSNESSELCRNPVDPVASCSKDINDDTAISSCNEATVVPQSNSDKAPVDPVASYSKNYFRGKSNENSELCRNPVDPVASCSKDLNEDTAISLRKEAPVVPQGNSDVTSLDPVASFSKKCFSSKSYESSELCRNPVDPVALCSKGINDDTAISPHNEATVVPRNNFDETPVDPAASFSRNYFHGESNESSELCRNPVDPVASCSKDLNDDTVFSPRCEVTVGPQGNSDETPVDPAASFSRNYFQGKLNESSELCRNPVDPVASCSKDLNDDTVFSPCCEVTVGPQGNSDETSYSSTSFEDSNLASPENSNELPPEDASNPDLRRTRRISKRKREFFEFCPICGVTVRLPELQAHFAKEVENLDRIHRTVKKPRREDNDSNRHYMQVKNNRENRLTAKVAQYATRAKSEVQCPACSLRISGTVHDMNKHVLYCLSQEDNSDEFLDVDNNDDNDGFEEYEFGNETRVRAVSLVPGGYNSLQGRRRKRQTCEEDEDLNVDVDDTIAYGQAQELDVIPGAMNDKEQKELLQLRRAVLENSDAQPHVLESRKWSMLKDVKTEEASSDNDDQMQAEMDTSDVPHEEKDTNSCPNLVVSSLKEKIRDLEVHNKSVKCLICLEPYTKPVVSTACWHVYCEECWLMTMGVKKLCPQCNMIVSPSDLRRIYL